METPEFFEDDFGRFYKKLSKGSKGAVLIRVEKKQFTDAFGKTIRYWGVTGEEQTISNAVFRREYTPTDLKRLSK